MRETLPVTNRFYLLFSLLVFLTPAVHAEVAIDTETLQLKFSDFGDLVSVTACLPSCADPGVRTQEFDGYRGFLSLNRDSGVVFERERKDGDSSVQLEFTNLFSNETRSWRIPHHGYLLGLEVSRPQDMAMVSGKSFLPPKVAGFGAWLETIRYVVFEDGQLRQYGLTDTREDSQLEQAWLGYRNRYWAAMIRPEQLADIATRTDESQLEAQLDIVTVADDPSRYMLYVGPIEPSALRAAHPDLEKLMYAGLWSWLAWICKALFLLLGYIHSLIPSWALAIIVMSLLVQLVMRPVNLWAERLQEDVQKTESRILPRLNEIKKGFKGADQAERILALYKEEKVHPLYSLKGMAGVLVIIPVFIGAFNMLSENIWLSGESFYWIKDLSLPDAIAGLPFEIPFLGDTLNLLPFIMVVFSVSASVLRNSGETDATLNSRNQRNLILMSLMFFLLFYTFPAGMVLYWVVNNVVSFMGSLVQRVRL
jgi:YidC/Oxa1 family membrane protein insertase